MSNRLKAILALLATLVIVSVVLAIASVAAKPDRGALGDAIERIDALEKQAEEDRKLFEAMREQTTQRWDAESQVIESLESEREDLRRKIEAAERAVEDAR